MHAAPYHLRLKELPPDPQPPDRLRDSGPAALSDAELLAILLRVGEADTSVLQLAQQLLVEHGGWAGLQRADYAELCRRHGVGGAKTAAIKAALEIGRRLLMTGTGERPQIRSPADVASLLMVEMSHLDQSHLRTVLLDARNHVMAIPTIHIESVNSAAIRVGEVFKEAVRRNAAAMIVVHYHPASGDPTPSLEDILLTRHLVEAGNLLDIDLLDYLILGHGRYVSMRERGLDSPST